MATRRTRRIADLVTEEVQKSTDGNQSDTKADATTNGAATPHHQDLEEIVVDLRTNLEQIQQREKSLQKQIAELQLTLEQQNKFVSKLQQDLESSSTIKAELEQAKRTILQLAETNSRLIEQMNVGKKEPKPEPKPEPKESKIQKYKNIPRYQTVVGKEQTGESTDFAAKSWLLD